MTKTVFKYQLQTVGEPMAIDMPEGARLLSVQLQSEWPTLWALVDPSREMTKRFIILVGTGHEHLWKLRDFLGTVQTMTGLVWHAFEVQP